jgi:hypothetical protein
MKSYSDGRIGTVVENRPAVGSSDDKVQQRDSRARTHAKEKNEKKFSSYKFDGPGKPFDLIGTAQPNGIISWERKKVAKGEEKKNRKSVVRD